MSLERSEDRSKIEKWEVSYEQINETIDSGIAGGLSAGIWVPGDEGIGNGSAGKCTCSNARGAAEGGQR